MKVAVPVPDELFKKADELANRRDTSRSQVFADALREYLDRHAPDQVIESINAVVEEIGTNSDSFVKNTSRHVLEQNEW